MTTGEELPIHFGDSGDGIMVLEVEDRILLVVKQKSSKRFFRGC
jgi:hypothetical protein